MAASTGFLSRIVEGFSGLMRSPNMIGTASGDEGETPAAAILGGMVSRNTEVSWIPDSYLDRIADNEDTILQKDGAQGLALYDALLDDGTAMSALQQRRLAITSRDWEVAPGDENDPRSVKAADDLRAMLKGLGWDRVTGRMHYAVWYGYAVAEGIYSTKVHDGRRIVWLDDIVVPNRRWFGFTLGGELRMLTLAGSLGNEPLPDNKFWALRTGASHDFAFYGLGLAHWCYWPVFFKRAAMKFWALYLEKYSSPTALGGFKEGTSDDKKGKLLASLVAIGQDRAVIVPEELVDKIKFMEPTRSGSGASSYQHFVKEQNDEVDRVILGQPGTSTATAQGIGGTQADVHADVKAEIVKADSDLVSEGFNNTFAKWLTLWNYGPDVAPPTVYRVLDDAEDLGDIADRDSTLNALGWQRTEQSFKDVYGEGYERKPESEIDPVTGLPADGSRPSVPAKAANDDDKIRRAAAEFGVDDIAPLYVYRALLNRGPLDKWAKANGLTPVVDDPHVTVLYSKTPVDWFGMGDSWGNMDGTVVVEPGGPRKVERLGDKGAVVLRFASPYLRYRHDSMIERGASHDYPEYLPHVTITYEAGDVDLDAIEPFIGELKFGPEIFEPIEVEEPLFHAFEARELDAIDRLVAALVNDSSPVFSAMAESLRENLEGVTTIEGARVAMLEAMERFPVEKLAQLTALPLLATRAAAVAGKEDAITA